MASRPKPSLSNVLLAVSSLLGAFILGMVIGNRFDSTSATYGMGMAVACTAALTLLCVGLVKGSIEQRRQDRRKIEEAHAVEREPASRVAEPSV